MKTCPICNTKNFDVNEKCTNCDYPLRTNPFEKVVAVPPQKSFNEPKPTFYVKSVGPNSIQSVAKAVLIISCVMYSISLLLMFGLWIFSLFLQNAMLSLVFLIGAIVCLPTLVVCIYMTNSYSYKIASGIQVGTAFKIITLLFVSAIAGILMLCDNGDQ